MKLIIGCDHGAFAQKEFLIEELKKDGHEVDDVGTLKDVRCNYTDFAIALCHKVIKGDCIGILLCGSGVGMSMAANRFKGIRAALCRTTSDAQLSRQHNNSNVLCLGGRVNSNEEIKEITKSWLESDFEKGRHIERLAKFENLGEDIEDEDL